MAAFVAACRGEAEPPLTLADATEATRIGVALTRSLRSGHVELVN
jgi:myo-inositol 2-dehydrogenase / D-chiro-inositol 1-dehydrogenase